MKALTRILGPVLILSACQSGLGDSHVTVRDSAGIQVVESSAPEWGDLARWTVSESPALDLAATGAGPPHEFFQVRDGLRLSDGRLAVADGGSSQVRFFSAEGDFIRAVGRPGDGPGEFRRMETLSRMRGDSIAVFDSGSGRLTVIDQAGDVARTIVPSGVNGRCFQLRSIHDSAFVGVSYTVGSQGNESGRYRMPYAILYFGPTGIVLDTVAIIRGFEGQQNAMGSASLPFGKDGHLAVRGQDLILGTADSLEFDLYREARILHQRVPVPGINFRLSPQEKDSTRQTLRTDGLPPGVRELVEGMEFPESKPAYARLLTDSDGFVWAAEYHRRNGPAGPINWTVFSPDGEWLGSVQTPSRFTVLDIGSEFILGVWRDGLDVEHVQLLGLERS